MNPEVSLKDKKMIYSVKDFNLWYGNTHALKNIQLDIPTKEVTAIIGPSGCGKSTFIKTLNRMVELQAHRHGAVAQGTGLCSESQRWTLKLKSH